MVGLDTELEAQINAKIAEIDAIANSIPTAIIIHKIPEFRVVYMSPAGLQGIGATADEVIGMNREEYFERYFNKDEVNDYGPKIIKMLQDNSDEEVSFFQQVRTSKKREWDWYMSSIKILLRDNDNKPVLSINVAQKVDPDNVFTTKAVKLIEENVFIRRHFHDFAKLGKREVAVLGLLALGKSASAIARTLNISSATAETHRRNIRRKLKVKNSYELTQYAQAFNLV